MIPPKYGTADDFFDGRAFVYENGKYGYIDKKGIGLLEKNKSEEMYFLWENLPVFFSRQINEYRAKLNSTSKSTENIKIKRPYIIIRANQYNGFPDNTLKRENTEIERYTKNEDSTKRTWNSYRTIIIRFAYFFDQKKYQNISGDTGGVINTYGTYLIYYDMQEERCIGHDNLMALKLPTTMEYDPNTGVFSDKRIRNNRNMHNGNIGDLFHSLDEVEKVVSSHLVKE